MAGKHAYVGSEEWRPTLLRRPDFIAVARQDWVPVLIRGGTITTVGLLAIFLALQFLIPARLIIGGMGAAGRPSVAIGILLGFLWLLSAIRAHRLPDGRQPIRWAVGVFVGAQLIGYAVGFDRLPTAGQASGADRWLIVVMCFAGVTLAVADGLRTWKDLNRVLQLLVIFACAMSLVGILQFFGVVDLTQHIRIPGLQFNRELLSVSSRGEGEIPRVPGTANHYIEFGVVLALVLPIALHYVLFCPPERKRAWRWAALGLIAMGIPLSISRSAIVTVVVALAFMAIAWTWRQRFNALVIAVGATAVFHVLNRGVLGTIRALFTNLENDTSVTDRIDRTGTVLDLWSQRPILGWGAGMVTPEEFLLLDNQFYMFLIAGGVLGVVAFLGIFAVPYLLGRSVRLRGLDQESRHLGNTLAATMPAALVASGTFDSFSFATFVAVMCILIGATGALWRLAGADLSQPLKVAQPGDKFVATPLTADVRRRLAEAWDSHRPATTQHAPPEANDGSSDR